MHSTNQLLEITQQKIGYRPESLSDGVELQKSEIDQILPGVEDTFQKVSKALGFRVSGDGPMFFTWQDLAKLNGIKSFDQPVRTYDDLKAELNSMKEQIREIKNESIRSQPKITGAKVAVSDLFPYNQNKRPQPKTMAQEQTGQTIGGIPIEEIFPDQIDGMTSDTENSQQVFGYCSMTLEEIFPEGLAERKAQKKASGRREPQPVANNLSLEEIFGVPVEKSEGPKFRKGEKIGGVPVEEVFPEAFAD